MKKNKTEMKAKVMRVRQAMGDMQPGINRVSIKHNDGCPAAKSQDLRDCTCTAEEIEIERNDIPVPESGNMSPEMQRVLISYGYEIDAIMSAFTRIIKTGDKRAFNIIVMAVTQCAEQTRRHLDLMDLFEECDGPQC